MRDLIRTRRDNYEARDRGGKCHVGTERETVSAMPIGEGVASRQGPWLCRHILPHLGLARRTHSPKTQSQFTGLQLCLRLLQGDFGLIEPNQTQ